MFSAQAQKFKFAVFTPDKEQTFVTTMKPFAELVNKESGGTCEIEVTQAGNGNAAYIDNLNEAYDVRMKEHRLTGRSLSPASADSPEASSTRSREGAR